jgi:aspartyl protease family protein
MNSGPREKVDKSPPTDGAGRVMMFIAWIIAIAMATWFFSRMEEDQHNPNRTPSSLSSGNNIEVTLEQNRYGHYLANGVINDKEVTFLLDTGATSVAIPAELEGYLNLERGYPFSVHTANGTATAYQTEIDYLKIGEIVLTNVNASIIPSMEGTEILLGMAALRQLEFRQKGKYLTLIQ